MKWNIKISVLFVFIILFILLNSSLGHSEILQKYQVHIDLWTKELFVKDGKKVIKEYHIAPGTEKSPTPIGTFVITNKSKSWGGGFGTRWLGLNVPWGDYGIHGTNKPWLVGKNVSGGCIRMRNEDVEELFDIISEGTVVHIDGPITGIGKGEFKNLSYGSKGNLVLLVQERLKQMKLYKGKINGVFDKETERAVKSFQKVNRLPVTGGVSEKEYILLNLLE